MKPLHACRMIEIYTEGGELYGFVCRGCPVRIRADSFDRWLHDRAHRPRKQEPRP